MNKALNSLPIPPSTLSALAKAGYETLDDLSHYDSANQLTDALKIPLEASHTLHNSSQKHSTFGSPSTLPLTQSAAALIGSSKLGLKKTFTTHCPPVDSILNGGMQEGQILELSGPPGSPKELILLNTVLSFVEAGNHVLFVDCQDMCDIHLIDEHTKNVLGAHKLVSYIKIHNLTEFMLFIHDMPSYSNTSLFAISCISFPFQCAMNLSSSAKSSLFEKIKNTFSRLASRNTSIVVTSQLATKLINTDGSTGTFDTIGAKGVLLPQLGPAYLPSGKAFRILVALSGPSRGFVRLLAPLNPGKGTKEKSFEMRGRTFQDMEV
ncbi:hypothetical protein BDP27DRAFT_1310058 [Rhodocollybia butyracea]|uniref:RecA family profile 1 domain-containing protein n=1 Tax=Rhodocollybia butyracea TaxID=206335 RepID=A0A9P5QCC3_9AGAR|nr:hypothetical protein BDP27DRAFT_1310058 [Rhodocollybia butyracea]